MIDFDNAWTAYCAAKPKRAPYDLTAWTTAARAHFQDDAQYHYAQWIDEVVTLFATGYPRLEGDPPHLRLILSRPFRPALLARLEGFPPTDETGYPLTFYNPALCRRLCHLLAAAGHYKDPHEAHLYMTFSDRYLQRPEWVLWALTDLLYVPLARRPPAGPARHVLIMYNSKIEWTDHSWNPWIGCTKVSPGCQHCYAESFALRFNAAQWGPQGERKRTSPANWRKPLTWNRQNWMQCLDCGWRGQANTRNARFACDACRSENVEPTRQRVFCASLADVFEDRPELVPWRAGLFDLIANTPNLDWLLLTKRPENIRRLWPWTPTVERPNIWLGTSVENQEQANKRIPELLLAPGSVRFLSCEPLLGPVNIKRYLWLKGSSTAGPWYDALGRHRGGGGVGGQMISNIPSGDLNWVICGGESGPHARPMHPDWARSLRDQCAEAGVPFFFKQWGEHLPRGQWNVHGIESLMYAAGCEAFGGTAPPRSIQWDEQMWAYKVGKHDAGRYLDERIHNAHPPIAPR